MSSNEQRRIGKRLIPWAKVHEQCGGLSRAEAWRLRKQKKFPDPVKIGLRRVAWIAEEVDEWVQHQIDRSPA